MTWKLASMQPQWKSEIFETRFVGYLGNSKTIKYVKIRMRTSPDYFFFRELFKNKKGPTTSFKAAFFIEFFDKILLIFRYYILIRHYIYWPNFITKLCLLLKLFGKMYFLMHA